MQRLEYQFLHQVWKWLTCYIYQYLLNDRVIAGSISKLCPRDKVNSHRCRVCGPLAVKYLDKRRHLLSGGSPTLWTSDATLPLTVVREELPKIRVQSVNVTALLRTYPFRSSGHHNPVAFLCKGAT